MKDTVMLKVRPCILQQRCRHLARAGLPWKLKESLKVVLEASGQGLKNMDKLKIQA